jgi:plasmid stabilization system protein ParE
MTRTLRMTEGAADSLLEATEFYSARSVVAARQFVDAVDAVTLRMCLEPRHFREVADGHRRARVPGFPFEIRFMADEATVVVLAIRHLRRA